MPYGTFPLDGVAESTVSDISSDFYHTIKTISIHSLSHPFIQLRGAVTLL